MKMQKFAPHHNETAPLPLRFPFPFLIVALPILSFLPLVLQSRIPSFPLPCMWCCSYLSLPLVALQFPWRALSRTQGLHSETSLDEKKIKKRGFLSCEARMRRRHRPEQNASPCSREVSQIRVGLAPRGRSKAIWVRRSAGEASEKTCFHPAWSQLSFQWSERTFLRT